MPWDRWTRQTNRCVDGCTDARTDGPMHRQAAGVGSSDILWSQSNPLLSFPRGCVCLVDLATTAIVIDLEAHPLI